jgi:hypothetical protein
MTKAGRWILYLAAFLTGSACIFSTPAASDSTPQVIVVTGDGATGSRDSAASLPTPETAGLTPTWTLGAGPIATVTTAQATLTAGQDLSCVTGPHWILYEWVAKILEGETVTLLARSTPEWPDYFHVRKADGTECWAFGGSSTTTGDIYSLPVREAPPLPEITYVIQNQTGLNVSDVFIRGKDETAWGADRIGAGIIAPGASFSLTLTAGFYDVLINDVYHSPLYAKDDWPIGSESSYRNIILNTELEFYIQNNYAFDLCTFSFRRTGGSWQVMHSAADGPIASGARFTFTLLPGIYDVQINRCTGPMVVNVSGVYFGPATPGYNLP